MKIAPITYETKTQNKPQKTTLSHSSMPSKQAYGIPSGAFFSHPSLMPKSVAFKGLHFENTVVREVKGKNFFGLGLYENGGGFLDFSKIGGIHLAKEPLDLKVATDKEVWAHWHATSLAEAHDTTWVRRYNKFNTPAPLATFPSLCSIEAKKVFGENLEELHDMSRHLSLDAPVTDKNGKFCLDCIVFDTETTGINTSDRTKPLDKIVQIGAIQLKKGKVVTNSAFNQLVDPEMPIPKGATNVHGITDDMVKGKPKIEEIIKSFSTEYMSKKNGVIVAYNAKFDMTLLNNAIRAQNGYSHENIKERRGFKVLDPFLLIQRIHPYLGAKKKLGEQYKYLFSKTLDGAHDAFVDVKGTANVLKYCLYQLSEHRKDKTKPLTVREALVFQNGGKVPNLDFPLNHNGVNAKVSFDMSYRNVPVALTNYFDGYKLTKETLNEIADEIGEENVAKLKKDKVQGKKIDLNPQDGNPINPAETKMQPTGSGVEDAKYTMKKNFQKVLEFAKVDAFGDKSKEEVIDLITKESENYLIEDAPPKFWMKNPNPEDIKDGNDLPDLEISRRVMREEE